MAAVWFAVGILLSSCIASASFLSLDVHVTYVSSTQSTQSSGGGGDDMYLRGDGAGLTWEQGVAMAASKQPGQWSLTLQYNASQAGTALQFKPLLNDAVWSIGANFVVTLPPAAPTSPSPASIPSFSSSVHVLPWFYTTAGSYSVATSLYSPQLQNTRDIVVYLPPSYAENTAKTYPLLLMHDGQNLFNDSTSFDGAWHCQDTVDAQVVGGNMEEVVIVGVYNTDGRLDEYTYSYDPCYDHDDSGKCLAGGGKGDAYLDFLEQQVLPWALGAYRVNKPQGDLGLIGSSLGGLISCYAGWTRPSVYGRVGCMSSSFWWNNQDMSHTVLPSHPVPPPDRLFYLDSGDCCPSPDGDDRNETATVYGQLQQLGLVPGQNVFYYLDQGAQHNEYYWGKRFYLPMQALYPLQPLVPQQSLDAQLTPHTAKL